MNFIKSWFFNKDIWISTSISSIFTIIFVFGGGDVTFMTSIQPWWYKLIFLGVLAVVLYFLCGVVERAGFKKLGRKPPE